MLIDEDPDSLRADGATHLCVASFDYDRYFQALSLPGQKAGTLERARRYQALFRYPHVEIRPAYRSFAFSNPVIRILDIRSGPEKGPR